MFRINYNKLTLEEVRAIVAGAGAPAFNGQTCACLAGEKLELVLDNEGIEPPELSYEFISADRLVIKENGVSVECAYGALSLKNIILFAHMIPGTLRGYTVVLDRENGMVTAEEMWFIDYQGRNIDTSEKAVGMMELSEIGFFVNREVERQIYRGYFVREGASVPGKRFEKGLRLDNKMILWDDDLGRRRVFTYISNYFSSMVEVGTPDGEDVLCLPSDYLQINDSMFFYSVGEVEYSGRLSVEVFDLFTMKKIGVVMGIDENDRFEFSLYTAKGRSLGQYATFYNFDDLGRDASGLMSARFGAPTKGFRGTYRTSVLAKKMTEQEMLELSRKEVTHFDISEKNVMIEPELRMEDSRECAGKKLTFRDDDGYEAEFDFLTDTRVRFRKNGGEWSEQEYRASQLDEHLVFLGFHVEGSAPAASIISAIDFDNGCMTVIDSHFCGGHEPHDVVNKYHFGYIVMDGVTAPRTRRHGFTRELLGRSFTWSYRKGTTSQHIYNSPHSYSWTIFSATEKGRGRGGFAWSGPCTYIKLRDDIYVMTWVEEKWSGSMSSVAMNLRIMHDTGFFLSIEHDGSKIGFSQISAFARNAGKCDMEGIFEL